MPLDTLLRRLDSFRKSHGKATPMRMKPLPKSRDLRGMRNTARARSLMDAIVEPAWEEMYWMSGCFAARRKATFVLAVFMIGQCASGLTRSFVDVRKM